MSSVNNDFDGKPESTDKNCKKNDSLQRVFNQNKVPKIIISYQPRLKRETPVPINNLEDTERRYQRTPAGHPAGAFLYYLTASSASTDTHTSSAQRSQSTRSSRCRPSAHCVGNTLVHTAPRTETRVGRGFGINPLWSSRAAMHGPGSRLPSKGP